MHSQKINFARNDKISPVEEKICYIAGDIHFAGGLL